MEPNTIASGGIDMGTLHGGITALTMLTYAGIFWWAYRSGNRARFEADALLPFADDEEVEGVQGARDARDEQGGADR